MISEGNILDIRKHPNELKYPDQKILYVRVEEVYAISFIEEEKDCFFLKTLFPTTKARKEFLAI